MKRSLLIALAVLLTFSLGVICGTTWVRRRQNIARPQADSQIPSDTFITLEKSPGYGPVPNYTLAISADGSVIFNGSYFVEMNGKDQWKKSGIVKGRIDQNQIRQLIAEFADANYFSLQDLYRDARDGCPNYATDQPRIFTSMQINGRKKAIEHYLGCLYDGPRGEIYPRELVTLESAIEQIVNIKQWMQ
jgi:hypothetical protein